MKKILHVVNVSFVIPSFFGNQFKYLKDKSIESHLICSPSEDVVYLAQKYDFKYKQINIKRSVSIKDDFFAIKEICNYIKQNKIDIVVGHTPKGALLSMIAGIIANVDKRIFFRHGLVYETTMGFKRVLLKNIERITSFLSTCVICVSPYLLEKSIEDHLSIRKKMIVLNRGSCNGVDAECIFNPCLIHRSKLEDLKKKYNISDRSFVIGFTGRVSKDKGVEDLIETFLLLQKKYNEVKLLIIGPLDERIGISEKYIEIIQNNKDIISTGLIKDNLQYYYALMDLFILPTHREGFGNVILEASAMKLPVLTTSHTGSRDAIINGITGFYVNLSPYDIASTTRRYIESEELMHEHGINGRNFVLNNFSEKIIWSELEKIYL